MSRYNHFADKKYKTILFSDVRIGDKFRIDKRSKKTRTLRSNVVCIKTGELSYMEFRTKVEKVLFHTLNYEVSHYSELNITTH